MKLSIIIVNYNVAFFLEQCLKSVLEAIKGIEAEVFVVDNNSVDQSVEMVKKKFKDVYLIENQENIGFAKANNQAIKKSCGEYVLLLNPDTIVEADTFEKIIQFMDSTPDAGGLGVKMVNGKGEFLPESKRSLPIPSVAFYKIFGLSKMFKKSRRFGKYHLTYLPEDEINEVDVLSGAFMLLRHSVLDKIGLLDEDYFMYGEDIDLSYRITQSGYKNYYFPQTRIIHYKGESTKKTSINYVFVFYKAMQIFAKKHFSHSNASLFSLLINVAIWGRALLSVIRRLLTAILMPLLDALLIYGGLLLIATHWHELLQEYTSGSFSATYLYGMLPVFTLIWILCIFFSKGYKKPIQVERLNLGVFAGVLTILIFYALLPEEYRYSRAVIVVGTAWTFMITNLLRYIIKKIKIRSYPIGRFHSQRILIIGQKDEIQRVTTLLSMTHYQTDFVAFVHHLPQTTSSFYTGHIGQLQDIITVYRIGVVIFCNKNMSTTQIIDVMKQLQSFSLEFKIAPSESSFIVGSNSILTSGSGYFLPLNSIASKENRHKKRILDILVALVLFFTLPFNIWIVKSKRIYIRNLFFCFTGKKTWVGYCPAENTDDFVLPILKKSVLFTTDSVDLQRFDTKIVQQLNFQYAKDYKWFNDIWLIIKDFKNLGR